MSIDWSKAPEGTEGWAEVGVARRPVWFGRDWYAYFGEAGKYEFSREGASVAGRYSVGELRNACYIPKKLEHWDGKGLPPVGIECEVLWRGNWVACEVIAHRKNFAVVYLPNEVTAGLARIGDCRPIRSAEQIDYEKEQAAIAPMVELIGNTLGFLDFDSVTDKDRAEAIARQLYREGYKKKPEGQPDE